MSKIVERTLDVFEIFATEKRPLSLTDLAHLLGIPMSSCHDVVRALESRGYVYETAPREGYYPTRRMHNVCEVIVAHDSLVQRARPLLEKLRDDLEETVSLAKATGLRVIYLAVLEPAHPMRFSVTPGSEIRSVHATSAGKAVLGSLPHEALEAWLEETDLKRLTHKTIVSKSQLLGDIRASQERGFFLNQEESLAGVVTASCAFTWSTATHVITVAGPAERMEEKLDRATRLLVAAARTLNDAAR